MIDKVRCMKCDFEGEEEDLIFMLEDEDDLESGMNACLNCKTDGYLRDIEVDELEELVAEKINRIIKMEKEEFIKYLKGIAKSLNALSKEINKFGVDKKSCDLMKEIGSDLLFKGTAQEFLK